MSYSFSLLICLILISSVICGILIVICSILICKYLYKYRRDRRINRDEMEVKINENQSPLIANIDSLYHQMLGVDQNATLDLKAANRYSLKDSIETNIIDLNNDQSHLTIIQTPNRRHSDNSPYKEESINFHIRPRSVSQTVTLKTVNTELKETSTTLSKIGNYRKNSFHLKPFDLFPTNRGKISHSMEFLSHTKASYDQIDERKVRSFDSDLIRLNSKSQNVYGSGKCKTKELSKSLMSFLQKLSKIKTKSPDDKIKSLHNGGKINKKNINYNNNYNNNNNIYNNDDDNNNININKNNNNSNNKGNESFIDLDLAYICPFQISQNRKNNLPKNGSLESSLYISSFDSSEMNEAFLAVSREIHNSCDSDLCYKSATVKRKQFIREKRKPINNNCDYRKHNSRYNQCISANQSMERDYSIDEKSSTLFKEFLRNDPNFDKDRMEENVRRRLRSERGFSHQNSQHRKRSKAKVIDGFKSASFTDGDSHPQTNIHVNSFESQLDSINRSPSPLPMIILSAANPF